MARRIQGWVALTATAFTIFLCRNASAQETATPLQPPEETKGFWDYFFDVLNYEIFHVEDASITLNRLLLGLIFIIFGFVFAKWVSRILGRVLIPKFKLEKGQETIYTTLTFYFLLGFMALLALQVARIPLTALTVIGGALAIGVGLGAQNLVKDFISGLVLLTERPIKVGDIIDVEGTNGMVERIGARGTRIRSSINTHLIVPNSFFLEKEVVNWTLSDNKIRTHISVGVVYGSNTREVIRLLKKAVSEHGRVLKDPEPLYLFDDFGENSLKFEVHFWIRMNRLMDRRIIGSDLRLRIDHLFRDAGITIAFHQRDVHLDTKSPLQVQMVEGEERDLIPRPQEPSLFSKVEKS